MKIWDFFESCGQGRERLEKIKLRMQISGIRSDKHIKGKDYFAEPSR